MKKYEGWKGSYIAHYFGHLDEGEWIEISWLKYHWLKLRGYTVRIRMKVNGANCKCPFCSTEMKGIELTHYKCKNCNLYFTN